MQVFYRLSRVIALIDNYAVSVFQSEYGRQLGDFLKGPSDQRGAISVHIRKVSKVLFGYAQKMNFRLGFNVLEYDDFVILVLLF